MSNKIKKLKLRICYIKFIACYLYARIDLRSVLLINTLKKSTFASNIYVFIILDNGSLQYTALK